MEAAIAAVNLQKRATEVEAEAGGDEDMDWSFTSSDEMEDSEVVVLDD